MNPGDLIEWFYESSHEVVAEDEELWSTLIDDWVPIDSSLVHVLISIDEKTTHVDERERVVPHTR